ncbi:hypothetical protein O3P69_004624 [Scylla paramamosain]|uniref:Methyltransferase FkbM domain-containing protein n=2 Tax=Scylla paramamosain TaxID=85552 RepID=A0AAW0UFZ2_SCYPA
MARETWLKNQSSGRPEIWPRFATSGQGELLRFIIRYGQENWSRFVIIRYGQENWPKISRSGKQGELAHVLSSGAARENCHVLSSSSGMAGRIGLGKLVIRCGQGELAYVLSSNRCGQENWPGCLVINRWPENPNTFRSSSGMARENYLKLIISGMARENYYVLSSSGVARENWLKINHQVWPGELACTSHQVARVTGSKSVIIRCVARENWPKISHQSNGVYLEAGAVDGEYLSNTVPGEAPGLVQKQSCPATYDALRTEGKKGVMSHFLREGEEEGEGEGEGEVTVLSLPLYTILLSLNLTQLDFLSLDLEGAELKVLRTVPWERVRVRVLCVECNRVGASPLTHFLLSQGYYHIGNFGIDCWYGWPSLLSQTFP